jgi:hypothetical protein
MQLHFDKAFEILGKTIPFVLLRLLVYGVILAGTLLWFGGIFLLFQSWPLPGPNWLAWVFGGVVFATVIKTLRNYVLYLLKAAHIAAITRILLVGDLPSGMEQLRYGKDLVLQRFGQVSILFLVDQLVNAVLKAFNRSIFSFIGFIPGVRSLRGFAQRVLDYSAGYVDEAILSYSIVHPELNPWRSARDGLILYVQSWKTILASGLVLALISYALVAVVAAPGILLTYAAGGPIRGFGIAISMALALFVKFALMDPFALTSVIVNYHRAIEGQTVNEEWDRRLENLTGRFRQIKDNAAAWEPPKPAPAPVRIP